MSFASSHVDTFLSGMATSGTALYNKIIGDVKGMQEDEMGLVSGSYNTRALQNIAGIMEDFFDSPTYENRLEKLVNSLPSISRDVVLASQKKFGRELPEGLTEQILQIQDRYTDELNGVVYDDAVEAAIISPYINDAFMIVGNSSEVSVLETRTRDLKDNFVHYFVTKVTTLVEMYEREIYKLISDSYPITHYKFKGVKDDRNRDWCHKHVNGIYTTEEIESWANETWDGQIPGTDALSIYVNLGGYNCRHILEPIKP